ncbi:hypothetical protein KCU92_g292, partial [Aureobasidium melanogenum]
MLEELKLPDDNELGNEDYEDPPEGDEDKDKEDGDEEKSKKEPKQDKSTMSKKLRRRLNLALQLRSPRDDPCSLKSAALQTILTNIFFINTIRRAAAFASSLRENADLMASAQVHNMSIKHIVLIEAGSLALFGTSHSSAIVASFCTLSTAPPNPRAPASTANKILLARTASLSSRQPSPTPTAPRLLRHALPMRRNSSIMAGDLLTLRNEDIGNRLVDNPFAYASASGWAIVGLIHGFVHVELKKICYTDKGDQRLVLGHKCRCLDLNKMIEGRRQVLLLHAGPWRPPRLEPLSLSFFAQCSRTPLFSKKALIGHSMSY